MNLDTRVTLSWNLLRYSFGAVILLAGLDKIFGTNLITTWAMYISPSALELLPFSIPLFLVIIGIVEVVVAVLMLTRFTRLAAFLSVAWLLLISVNLFLGGYVDIAIRDILLAIAAYVMAELTTVVKGSST